MTNKNYIVHLAAILVMLSAVSCSNQPTDEKLKQLIIENEKANIDSWNASSLVMPCGFGKTFEIPKTFARVIDLLDASAPQPTAYESLMSKEQKVLDNLAMANIIVMEKTKDTSGYNQLNRLVTSKAYNISLTEKGKSILLGQTGDNYKISLIDLTDIKLLKTTKISSDTLKIDYMRMYSSAFNAISDFCKGQNENHYLPKDSSFVKLIYESKEWKVL